MNAALCRRWATDAHQRARWLLRESKHGEPDPARRDAFHRARLADVFALIADGHHEAAERLRRTIPLPTSAQSRGEASMARRGAVHEATNSRS